MAESVKELRERVALTPSPAPGQGLTLDPNTRIPPSVAAYLTGADIVYAQIVANVTGIAGTTFAGSSAIVTCPVTAFDGSPVWVEVFAFGVFSDTAASRMTFVLNDGGVDAGSVVLSPLLSTTLSQSAYGRRKITPTAGLHTYGIAAFVSAGSGTVTAAAGTASTVASPTWVRISRA